MQAQALQVRRARRRPLRPRQPAEVLREQDGVLVSGEDHSDGLGAGFLSGYIPLLDKQECNGTIDERAIRAMEGYQKYQFNGP